MMVGLGRFAAELLPWLVATLLNYCLVAQGMKRFISNALASGFNNV